MTDQPAAGSTVAADRDELLAAQAKARAIEHRRRQAERAAVKDRAALVPDDPPEPTPVAAVTETARPLSRQERHEAAELAANRRTVWLPEPVVAPGTNLRVCGYDPLHVPDWLREVLAEQVAA